MFVHVGHIVKGNALAYNYSLHGCGTELIVYCSASLNGIAM